MCIHAAFTEPDYVTRGHHVIIAFTKRLTRSNQPKHHGDYQNAVVEICCQGATGNPIQLSKMAKSRGGNQKLYIDDAASTPPSSNTSV